MSNAEAKSVPASRRLFRRVAVLGAGVMGAQIAAHLVNAGVEALLYDLPPAPPAEGQAPAPGGANAIAVRAIEGLKKLNPAPLGVPALADLIQPANYDEDLARLTGCDLVIEAIAERMAWKHDLYRKVAPHLAPGAIFATNTSGLSINALAEGMDPALRSHFCGVHFFNPPRYMPLVELIPTTDTDPAVLDDLETFLTAVLGKTCVRARDTPNFIANRLGTFQMFSVFHQAAVFGLGIDVIDDLTGAKLGRARSGTFRTADVVGLDTVGHVMKTMQDHLGADPFRPLYETPPLLAGLIATGALGQKTGAGFYRKESSKEGGRILRIDAATGAYVPAGAKADETVVRILKKKTWAERLGLLRASTNPQAQFLWAVLRDGFHYAACKLEEVADTVRDVDLAMRMGYGAELGPFEIWQQAGWTEVADWIRADIAAGKAIADVPLPAWVDAPALVASGGPYQAGDAWSPTREAFVPVSDLPVYARQIFRAQMTGDPLERDAKRAGTTVFEDESIRLWTLAGLAGMGGRSLPDDVLIASIKSRMHAIGPGVIAGLLKGIGLAEQQYRALVVWSPDEPFSVGADLQAMLPLFMSGGVKAIEPEERRLQEAMLSLRYAQVPTVAAIGGMALGGGCELGLYCARRVALLESYIGLVEVGVGLVPGAGGLTYGARRAAEEQAAAPGASLLAFLQKYLTAAATAQVSRSALEARAMGYLLDSDRVVLHRQELLFAAVHEAAAMSEIGYRPPPRSLIPVAGRSALATVSAQLLNMREGGLITGHDHTLGRVIAEVLCGGEVEPGTRVDEAWLMTLERRAFMRLLADPKTQQRIMGMMQTGKPVRN